MDMIHRLRDQENRELSHQYTYICPNMHTYIHTAKVHKEVTNRQEETTATQTVVIRAPNEKLEEMLLIDI